MSPDLAYAWRGDGPVRNDRFRHANGVSHQDLGGGVVTEACPIRGISSTGNENSTAEEPFSCFYLAASSLDRKWSEVGHRSRGISVARSV